MKKPLPLAAAALLGVLLVGCSASASLTVDPDTLADKVATALQQQVGAAEVPSVDCGTENVELKDANVVMCTLTDGTAQYDVTVTLAEVDGTKFSFDAKVADAPQ